MKKFSFTVDDPLVGQRIDVIISALFKEFSRNHIQKTIEQRNVKVDGRIVGKSFKPAAGSLVEFSVSIKPKLYVVAQEIPLDIRFEDSDLLVVNKPKGLVVHPATANLDGTLANALRNHCKEDLSVIGGDIRPGIVHRIDKDTSGLLLVAKNDFTHKSLAKQLKNHTVLREYKAVVYGCLKHDEGTIEAPIGRNTKDRKKMCVTQKNSRIAITHYTLIEQIDEFSYISVKLETGRMHQIRVHMARIGRPLAGDWVYGPSKGIR